jgi:hypothetical protein
MDGCVHLSSIYDKETKVQTSVGWLFDLLKFSKLFKKFRNQRNSVIGFMKIFRISEPQGSAL